MRIDIPGLTPFAVIMSPLQGYESFTAHASLYQGLHPGLCLCRPYRAMSLLPLMRLYTRVYTLAYVYAALAGL